MQHLWAELKRRNVFRVAMVYLAAAWLTAQIIGVVSPAMGWSPTVLRGAILIVAIGFPVALFAAWLFEITPQGVKPSASVPAEQSVRAQTGRKLERAFLIVLALCVVLLVGNQYLFNRPGDTMTAENPGAAIQTAENAQPDDASIAVLPFIDLSPEGNQAYFSDGISEEILNSLAQVKGLRVIGRTSSFAFRGQDQDLREIGQTLNARNILEGSVRKSGDKLRITAQLIDADSGIHKWSQTYDRSEDDVFAIQEEIAKAVSQAIGVTLGIGQEFRVPGMTRNARAYDLLLKSRSEDNKYTWDGYMTAAAQLQEALEIDPDFAYARLALYSVYGNAATNVLDRAAEANRLRKQAREQIEADAQHPVFQLAVRIGEAYWRGDKLEEERLMDEAQKVEVAGFGQLIGPENRARIYLATGQIRRGTKELEALYAGDPLNRDFAVLLGRTYIQAGDSDIALSHFDRLIARFPDVVNFYGYSALAALETGDKETMRTAIERAIARGGPGAPYYSVVLDNMDAPAKAIAEIKRMAKTNSSVGLIVLAREAAYFGDPALALELTAKLAKASSWPATSQLWSPMMRDMRQLPGFKDFAQKFGLTEYWRATGHWADVCHPVGEDDFACD